VPFPATRADVLPDVPSLSEFVPGYDASGWYRIGAPKGTPAEIVNRLNTEINAGLANPRLKARLADLGYAYSRELARRLWQLHCPGNREMGQGD
jgi:tripartite-type tricarboxylate transporter receptor subunit TctC